MKTKIRTYSLALFLLIAFSAASAGAEEFNEKYAAPFGFYPDARVENTVRFSYFTEQGTVEGVDKPVHGGIFALQLAFEDVFGFELQTIWRRSTEDLTFVKDGELIESESHSGSAVEIVITPKYRFLDMDWVWGSVSLSGRFPLSTKFDQTKMYGVDPAFQFYFDTGDWFGIETDVAYLMRITDPEEVPYVPGYEYAPQDDEKLVHGVFGRVNFLLKIFGQHFINVQVDDTYWIHSYASARNQGMTREDEIRRMVSHAAEPKTESDKLDLMYWSRHQLNVGGGYRVNLGVFEGGLGAFVALTDRDRRQNWGVNLDTRFTF